MVEHWKLNGPPAYMSIASVLGLVGTRKSGPRNPGPSSGYGDLDELASMFAGTGGVI